jgi:hypothetical protein
MTFSIPANDPSWLRLPDSVRRDATAWAAVLNAVHAADNRAAAIRAAARTHRGFSRKNIIARYYRVRREGWKACVNWSKVSGRKGLPALFVEHWIKLNESFQRDLSGRRALDRLKQQFRRWAAGDHTAAVPGFKQCPKLVAGLPRGCSHGNLMRILKARQSQAESILARRGIAAARAHLPNVPQDVSDIRPLEYVVFDDVEVDFLISITGSTAPVKIRLLVAMDLCSRVILGFGVRPAVTRPDGVEDSLKLRDMKCVVARFLSKWGYPLDYRMTFIVERATATLKEGDIAALHEISNGQIHVSLTSMIAGSVFEFRDRATGNSWGKAWLESFFNWLHNELGDREGQKGRRYDLAPAELHGRTRELALLMRAGQRMPLALRQQLRVPFMSGAEALQEISAAFAKANDRTDHALQGHDEIQLYRVDPEHPWRPREELPLLAIRLGLDVAALSQRAEWSSRMESPNERLQGRIAQVSRQEVGPAALHRLMDEHRRVKFSDFQFSFDYQGKEYIYLPGDALCVRLEHEDSYLAWFDPADLSVIYLTRDFPHRGWIGEVKLFRRTRRGELEEKKEALAATKHALARAAGLVGSRHPEKFDSALARAEQNIEVIRNVAALEIEVDVATPLSGAEPDGREAPASSHRDVGPSASETPADDERRTVGSADTSVREMTNRILARAAAKTEEKSDRLRGQSAARFGEILRTLSGAESGGREVPASSHRDVGPSAPDPIESWEAAPAPATPAQLEVEEW